MGQACRQLSRTPLPLLQHALRLAAFGQLHKVLGMDPLPSKMPKKPKNENPVDYTGMHAMGAQGLGSQQNGGRSLSCPVLMFPFSANPPEHHLCHPAHETPDGGGWGGQVSQQKEEEDSEERYKHVIVVLSCSPGAG